MGRRLLVAVVLAAVAVTTAAPALAHDPPSPPYLKTRYEAPYPQEALAGKIEGDVGLELDVDESGRVTAVRVVRAAGHGFDDAAAFAARSFVFEPAREGDGPVRSTVQYTYAFRLPPPAPEQTPAAPATASPQEAPAGETQEVLVRKPISAASSFAVRDRDFQLRPIGSVQDILRVTPGLVMVQHSGGGKASQYFLRGFDADHGTDIALSIDGVPINMVSHAHGQGFADTNFIIPEVVERVEITKGPYFASQGDFATAGAVNLVSRDAFTHSSIGFGVSGSPGHGQAGLRGLVIASPKTESLRATFAAEVGRQNGPFDNPEKWDKYRLFNKVKYEVNERSSFTLGEMSYGGTWHGSGQIPARAVESGQVSRFGSIDPDEGGDTARHQLSLQYKLRPSDASELKVLAYAATYRFDLYSDFTLFARDPVNGDEIEQVDRRVFYGGKASYRVVEEVGPVRFDTTLGGDARSDDVHEELWNTAQRRHLAAVRNNDVHETLIGAFVNEEVTPVRWLRLDAGARADALSFAVDQNIANDPAQPSAGVDGASQLSPKLSAVVTPIEREQATLDLYANYGHGFHSNDVRGAFATPAVTPLTRAIGEEVGARARLLRKIDLAAAGWMLDLANETVWNGDDGTTSVGDATRRYGLELEARWEILPWLAADGDVTFTKSYFSRDGANGGGLVLAPKRTWAGGLSARHQAGPGVARAGLRFYGIGDRPASDDGVLVAPGFTQVDLHAGYRWKRFDLALDVENLLDGKFRSAQFDTVSRLPNEPAVGAAVPAGFTCGSRGRVARDAAGNFAGCEDVDFTPAYPFTMRVMGTFYLD